MKALLFAAGPIREPRSVQPWVNGAGLVICADGGLAHALALGLRPDLLIGDFDSIAPALLLEARRLRIPVHQVPAEKDQTDTHLAIEEAIRRGASELILVGGTGGRLDHTLCNLLLMPGLAHQVSITIVDDQNIVRLLRPGGRLFVQGAPGDLLSLLPLSPEVKGVVAEGVKWPLDGATLRWGSSLGVSNQLESGEAFLAVREGYLLVISAHD